MLKWTPDITSFKKIMINRDEKIQEQIIKPKDKAIQEFKEQNFLLTMALNKQIKTVDKAINYEKDIKPILDEHAEFKENVKYLKLPIMLKYKKKLEKLKTNTKNRFLI